MIRCGCMGYHEDNLDWLVEKLKTVIDELNSELETVYKYIDTNDERVENTTENFSKELYLKNLEKINSNFLVLNSLIQKVNTTALANVQVEIMKLMNTLQGFNNNILYNPFNGYVDTLQNIINTIFNRLLCCLTVNEYAELSLTTNEYKKLNWTATYYAEKSCKYKKEINWDLLYVDPSSMQVLPLKRTIDWLVLQHTPNGITVDEYKAKDLTMTQYAEKNISATDYYFNSKNLL